MKLAAKLVEGEDIIGRTGRQYPAAPPFSFTAKAKETIEKSPLRERAGDFSYCRVFVFGCVEFLE